MGCDLGSMTCTDKQTLDLNDELSRLLHDHLMEYAVLVYTNTHCAESASVVRLLEQRRVKFESFNLQHMSEGPQLLKVLQTVTRQQKAPFVFVNRKHIGAVTELKDLISKRK